MAVGPGLGVPEAIGPDEVLGGRVQVASVAKLQVGREGLEELLRRDPDTVRTAQVAEVNLAEGVPLVVPDTAGRIVA